MRESIQRVVIPYSRTSLWLLLHFPPAISVVVGLIYSTYATESVFSSRLMLWGGILGTALFALIRLQAPAEGFVIEADGFIDNSTLFFTRHIYWKDVRGIRISKLDDKCIVVDLIDPSGFLNQCNWWSRFMGLWSNLLVNSPVCISCLYLSHNSKELCRKMLVAFDEYLETLEAPSFTDFSNEESIQDRTASARYRDMESG